MAGNTVTIVQVILGIVIAIAAVFMITEKTVPTPAAQEPLEPTKVEIKTNLGNVQGVEVDIGNSRVIYSFKGIPFAKPPVGDLRFKDPVAIEPWLGVKGGQTPPVCSQVNYTAQRMNEVATMGQEDCLYLNVHAPKKADSTLLPVMVFIHGGGFAFGDAEIIGGTPKFLLTQDVLLVSIQYRLGTLGFLSTGDSVIPGNFGMKDQTLALRWVHDNIREFGGDPSRVTIFGQSAGGTSVHLHVLSPLSKGLFQSAIPMSGTALAPFAIRDDHKQNSAVIGRMLGCSSDGESIDSSSMLACLQKAPLDDVVLAINAVNNVWNNFPYAMVPRVDGDFLPQTPAQLLKDGRYNKVNIMAGMTEHEMHMVATVILQNETKNQELVTKFDIAGPLICGLDTEEEGIYMSKRLFYHYADGIEITKESADDHGQLFTDAFFSINLDEMLLLHARDASDSGKKVFAYEFQFFGKDSILERFNISTEGKSVGHGSEMRFLFNEILGFSDSQDPTNLFVSEIMVKLWTDFAITGNPTPDLSLGFKWLPVSSEALHYLGITPSPEMRADNRAEIREYWKRLPTRNNKILYEELFDQDPVTSK